jgi:hypothetical protein
VGPEAITIHGIVKARSVIGGSAAGYVRAVFASNRSLKTVHYTEYPLCADDNSRHAAHRFVLAQRLRALDGLLAGRLTDAITGVTMETYGALD